MLSSPAHRLVLYNGQSKALSSNLVVSGTGSSQITGILTNNTPGWDSHIFFVVVLKSAP